MNSTTAKIKEIFVSTQGEGPYIGYKQLFVRFCGCNLSCDFCDTNFIFDNASKSYSVQALWDEMNKSFDLPNIHSVSFTGGEPLLHSDFLKKFLPVLNHCHYLETNATLSNNMESVLDLFDIISADIKLPSATGVQGTFEKHDKFFEVVRKRSDIELFAKSVFDERIEQDEIVSMTKLAKKYGIPLILQPKTSLDGSLPLMPKIEEVFDNCLKYHKNTRLIPQVHKFLDIR